MKIFETLQKINFIDENNVFVGFEHEQKCCEKINYVVTNVFPSDLNALLNSDAIYDKEYEGYTFDPSYMENVSSECSEDPERAIHAVVFKLLKDREYLYLTLINSHNGYYHHGFHMTDPTIPNIHWKGQI